MYCTCSEGLIQFERPKCLEESHITQAMMSIMHPSCWNSAIAPDQQIVICSWRNELLTANINGSRILARSKCSLKRWCKLINKSRDGPQLFVCSVMLLYYLQQTWKNHKDHFREFTKKQSETLYSKTKVKKKFKCQTLIQSL